MVTRIIEEAAQGTGSGILELVEACHIGRLRRYRKGSVLFWQGDPVECVFVVKRGKVKTMCLSPEGKVHTYEILGPGRLVGATAYLLGGEHESTAEILGDTDAHVILLTEFEHLLTSNSAFSMAVMRELAQAVHSLASKVEELSFMDVKERLKHGLVRLADEYGIMTEGGVKIDLNITHDELAKLVAADRSTITTSLSDLERQGYLWKDGRHLVIPPPEHRMILDGLSQAVVEGDEEGAISWANKAVQEKVDPIKALETLTSGMRQVDKGFGREELALPDVLMAALAMQSAMAILEEEIKRKGEEVRTFGTVIIGTVKGDIHDIGKTMVEAMLVAAGFKVVDIGNDQLPSAFVEAAEKNKADIVGASALMSTTRPGWKDIIEYFEAVGIREKYKLMVGGGGDYTRGYAEEVGADGFAKDAAEAVKVARRLMGIMG